MGTILAFVPDLMFGTRVEETARHLGIPLEFLNPGEDAGAAVTRLSPSLVVVALDARGWEQVVAAAKAAGVHVLGFGSHKDVDTLRAARAAGCDAVVARSRMAAELPNLLEKHAR